ncbi:hypothetical protein D3C77_331160 [compost metagenome]
MQLPAFFTFAEIAFFDIGVAGRFALVLFVWPDAADGNQFDNIVVAHALLRKITELFLQLRAMLFYFFLCCADCVGMSLFDEQRKTGDGRCPTVVLKYVGVLGIGLVKGVHVDRQFTPMTFKRTGQIIADKNQLLGFRPVVTLRRLTVSHNNGVVFIDLIYSHRSFGLIHVVLISWV